MRRCLYFSPSVSPTTMNSISSFPKDLMKTLKRTFYETRETRDVNETRDLNKGGELIEVDMLLDEKATLIQGSISEHRLNTFRHLLREGTTYEISGFDDYSVLFFLQISFILHSSLIKISVSVHRLNTFRELLKEGALYELSGFDVTRSNNHFKLCNSNVAIRLNQSTKLVEVPAVANPR
ncbi:hypothetical protein HID58_085543 [Brassica napus]|uniref:Uncharacterized protein n=1 Tax=Brassica napus TaxID=3708 RepID=A0ABQ7XMY7_BRANA|nr:hypothetical protein HID58_085543 [Brassica napus]